MVVFPLDFEILNESIPINFKESTAPLSVDFREVEVVSDYTVIGLTDQEIELLNTILTDGTAISQPEMTATYSHRTEDPGDPNEPLTHIMSVSATVTNIDKAFVKKAEVGWYIDTGSLVDVIEWYDAEITLGDTEHIISYEHRSQFIMLYRGLVVRLTYYSLIGGTNYLTVEAVSK